MTVNAHRGVFMPNIGMHTCQPSRMEPLSRRYVPYVLFGNTQ